MSTFLVYTPPAAGHVYPLVPGLRALQARGHRVHVRTSAGLAAQLRAAGLDATGIDPALVESVEGPRAGAKRPNSIGHVVRQAPRQVEDLRAAIGQVRPDALLVDTITHGAAVAAEASGLPWATTLPSLLPLPEPGIPPYGLGLAPAGGPLGALRDRVLWRLVEKAYGRDILPTINRLRSELGLATLDSPIQHVLRPSRLIVLTGAPLEYPRHALPASVRLVGIEPWDPPADAAPSWLTQDGDPWVLVTCSTHYQGDEALAAAAIEALRDEPYRVLVTLADAHGADLPSAANARVERFVSHGQVLPHAAAVVCPSGMGIVAKSLAARVPIVAVPFGRDQPEVARRVVEAGVGVRLPRRRLTPERLREAVRAAVALRPQVERGATAMDVCAAAGRFADAAEELLPGGSAPITSEPVLSASA